MPELAKTIRVERTPGLKGGVTIDGEPFPWYIAEDGIDVGKVSRDEMPSVTLTIIADRVEVSDVIDDSDDAGS